MKMKMTWMAVLGLVFALAPTTQATDWTFTSTTDGEWTQDGNWNLAGYPNAAGDSADFDSGFKPINVASPVTIGGIPTCYSGPSGYSSQFSGPASITFDNNGASSCGPTGHRRISRSPGVLPAKKALCLSMRPWSSALSIMWLTVPVGLSPPSFHPHGRGHGTRGCRSSYTRIRHGRRM